MTSDRQENSNKQKELVMSIKMQRVRNECKFTLDNGKTLYAYKDDYAVTHNRNIYIIKKMTWGSQTTAWVAFHYEKHDQKFESRTLNDLKKLMDYKLNNISE
jgi:hypothetical protein